MEDPKKTIRDALGFIVSKKKNKKRAEFTANGDIKLMNLDGSEIATYPIPNYRPPNADELNDMERIRLEKVSLAEQEVTNKYKQLREASRELSAIDESDLGEKMIARSNLIGRMRDMQSATATYSDALYPEKRVDDLERVPYKLINVGSKDDSILTYPIYRLKYRPFEISSMFERESELLAPEQKEVPAERETYIIVNNEHWLSPDITTTFMYEGETYSSIRQAIEVWKARAMGNIVLEGNLMRANSGLDARALGISNMDIPTDILAQIIKARLDASKPNKILFKNMQDAIFIYLDTDRVLGVGRNQSGELIRSRADWTGQNRYGLALVEVKKMVLAEAMQPKRSIRRTIV